VDAVRRGSDGRRFTVSSGAQRHYSAVFVANRRLWQHSWPDLAIRQLCRHGHAYPRLPRPRADAEAALDEDELKLLYQVVAPEQPGLYFLGLVQPIGLVRPIARGQATWIFDLFDGVAKLPNGHGMKSRIGRFRNQLDEHFSGAPQHAMRSI